MASRLGAVALAALIASGPRAWAQEAAAPQPTPAPATSGASSDDWTFALYLLQQHDGFRAISSLKHFAFAHRGAREEERANLLIGRIYSDAGQPVAARFHFELALRSADPRVRMGARLLWLQELCLKEKGLRRCVQELDHTEDVTGWGLVPYLKGYALLQLGEQPLSASLPDEVAPPLRVRAERLLLAQAERAQLPLQSPALAGILSAVVPGSGQAYNGRWVDAALALTLTGLPTYGAVRFATDPQPNVWAAVGLGLLAAVFYVGGIANSVSDARRINEQRYEAHFSAMEERYWPRVTLAASPDDVQFGVRFADEPALKLDPPAEAEEPTPSPSP